ncbi:MAG: ethylbenzene dehydrogenase-related protein [bacterium]|nr:ethylbenzene dehydrogenase-related protein [bacterium]MDT8396324.1 ethylbenzene dehydrogenase-related protein [bacterium]
MTRLPAFLFTVVLAALLLAAAPSDAGADRLRLPNDQLYALASFSQEQRATLLDGLRKENPDLILTDLTREDTAVRIHFGSRGFVEFLGNELYSLAVYVPAGIESAISRRSSAQLRVGLITRDAEGVNIFLGNSSGARQQDLELILTAGTTDLSQPARSTAPKQETVERETAGKVVELPTKTPTRVLETMEESSVAAAPPRPPAPAPSRPKRKAAAPAVKSLRVPVPRVPLAPLVSEANTLAVVGLDGPPPVLDGKAGDGAWASAAKSRIKVGPGANQVEAAAVSTSDRIYFLFSWPDNDPASDHQPWLWNEEEGKYDSSAFLDDGIAVWWGRAGKPLVPSAAAEIWDLWMWRAGREGLGQHASDARLSVSRQPLHMATYEDSRYSNATWTRLEFDRGRLPYEIVIPLHFSGPKVASYAAERPDNSASDVLAAGTWSDGKWVVELSRSLLTGQDDDLPFERGENRSFVLSLLGDEALATSPASGVLTVRWDDSKSKEGE